MKKEHEIMLIVGIFYLIFILLFISKFNFNPSATIELSEKSIPQYNGKLSHNLVIQKGDGFDGQYYYIIATDLLHKRSLVSLVWFQRIVYPLLAYIFVLGDISLLPWSLLLINFFSIILGTYLFIKILKKYKANLNLAYLWALNAGFLIAITRDLTEPLMFLFIMLAVYYLEEKNILLSSFFFVYALLTKEATLLILLPLLCFFLVKRRFKDLAIFSIPLLAFLIWQVTIFIVLNKFAIFSYGDGFVFDLPFTGVSKYLLWVEFPENPREVYHYFSILPLLFFSLIQIYTILKSKIQKFTPYLGILLFQIFIMFTLKFRLYTEEIDGMGRYAISLFLFSILYSVERKQKYDCWLILIMIFMSFLFFAERLCQIINYFVVP